MEIAGDNTSNGVEKIISAGVKQFTQPCKLFTAFVKLFAQPCKLFAVPCKLFTVLVIQFATDVI